MYKENLLIIGGCHVINDRFITELKEFYHLKSIKKIFTHINDKNFEKILSILVTDKDLLNKNYNIIIQIGNLHYYNSILNVIPQKWREIISRNVNTENLLSIDKGNTSEKFPKGSNLVLILRSILKILVLPFNLFYITIKGFYTFNKIKKILEAHYSESKIIIFTPIKTIDFIDNIFKRIGVLTVKIVFNKKSRIKVFDFYNLKYNTNFYKDPYHLNEEGINFYILEFEKQNLFS